MPGSRSDSTDVHPARAKSPIASPSAVLPPVVMARSCVPDVAPALDRIPHSPTEAATVTPRAYTRGMRNVVGLGLVWALVACGDDSETSDDTTAGDSGATSTATSASSTPTTDSGPPPGDSSGGPGSTTDGDSTSDTGDDATGDSTGAVDDFPDVDVSDPQLYEFELDPAELDPSVAINLEVQYAHLDTTAPPLGKLVIFLSGFTNTPSSWRDHGRQIAGWGFHVVEPDYSNDWDCSGQGGTCSVDSRWEALMGEDLSTIIDVSRADSAEGRVVTMLRHLQTLHPGGDWAWYLDDDDTLRYEHIIIAGISHGAASTGLYATRRPFSRAVMHSGGWWDVDETSETPVSEFFGLTHVDDEQHQGHLDAWENAGLPGAPTVLEDVPPPYGDSHRIVATTPNGYPHCSVCVSGQSPMMGDAYVFDPAWRYMYGAPQP